MIIIAYNSNYTYALIAYLCRGCTLNIYISYAHTNVHTYICTSLHRSLCVYLSVSRCRVN